jgi:tRNA nucleotidyltransferase (CCA-adding enzyme)
MEARVSDHARPPVPAPSGAAGGPIVVAGLRERIRALAGMDELLPLLERLSRTYLVGGAVRDLLRGERAVDLDVAIEGDAAAAARELADRLGGAAVVHERFGTATVRTAALALDLASTRRERYEQPGALPVVEAAPLEEDLARRDFTVNAMAAALRGDDLGRLHDPRGGSEDLRLGLIRVLHEHSFVDDPTRLLRAVRYAGRLRFAPEERTEALAAQAADDGALETVSGPRLRDELLDLLREPSGLGALRRLRGTGVARALLPWLPGAAGRQAVLARAVAAHQAADVTGADRALAALAALAASRADGGEAWLARLALRASERERVQRAVAAAPLLARELTIELRSAQVHALLAPVPAEALALALALGASHEVVGRYLSELSSVRLEITGADLIAAGTPEGPAIGRALRETLRRKLDGEVAGRDAELRLALELVREDRR